ncbi:sensor histidine kinase [Leptospira selangorensis]|uniref:Oxygen sensor histidine kinase NreB n=1 Tax=Leptospira selangorensis TaxID=2484982 RepID=A0A5F2BVH3_9LEPT|nr:sensor histidine kinase [Leptospira selangorensis]TGM11885.1 sensor histidine kinase [Leptospira selangorensis]TGM15255.1 sensor histidine kinase [Leptospira selangorensis]
MASGLLKRKDTKQSGLYSGKEQASKFLSLVEEISPIVALDENNTVRFANASFKKEFRLRFASPAGKNLFNLLKLDSKEEANLRENLHKALKTKLQNQEFKKGKKSYGYSIFKFKDSLGMILKDITENKKLEKKIATLHTQVLASQEEERSRLARELHDGVGQLILAAKLHFQAYQKSEKEHPESFGSGLGLIDRASQELREIYTNLQPSSLKELGLEAALSSLANQIFPIQKIKVKSEFRVPEKIPQEIQNQVFRILQEICANILKHSQANKVELKIFSEKDTLVVSAKDNGKGFKEKEARIKSTGYGLENIRRRTEDLNGTLFLETEPNKGTQYVLRIPLKKRSKEKV